MSNPEMIISLHAYASVMAGLGAGLNLRRALVHAEVPAAAWDRASEHWQAQIDESAASDLAVLVAFDGALLAARRRFDPTIEPIESDARAWSHFRRHFVTATSPTAFLAQRDLSLTTYARIEADWANRLLADAALAAAVQGHMEGPLEECPALTLIPSPWLREQSTATPAALPARPPEAAPVVAPAFALPPGILPPPAVLPPPPVVLPPPAVLPPPVVTAPPASRPSYLRELPASIPDVVIMRPREDLSTTRADSGPPSSPPTPFGPSGGARAVLPFQGRGAPTPAPIAVASTPRPPPTRPSVDLGSTVAATSGVSSPVLPFGGPTAPIREEVSAPSAWDRPRASRASAQPPSVQPPAPNPPSVQPPAPQPPSAQPLSPLPQLTIDQYAWIVAKLRNAAPADLPRTLANLRLTTETREQLEAYWRARMAVDPALRQAFIAALGGFLNRNPP